LHLFRQAPFPHIQSTATALTSSTSPFDIAEHWENAHEAARLSASATSAWRQYQAMCALYGRPPLPLSVVGLVAYMLY
jgi:hypothetical protein